ncbi:MAG: hypothetical protein EOP21_08015 [Hyphomicrobiales bacterium]|nr:MAG: hypothetical protein EOP21_08015 [Hyphomicrobiales bacterium]
MAYYRFYFFDRAGRIQRADDGDYASDEAAIDAAKAHAYRPVIEVWQQKRRVGVVENVDEVRVGG